jgi:hypothetical protein
MVDETFRVGELVSTTLDGGRRLFGQIERVDFEADPTVYLVRWHDGSTWEYEAHQITSS